MKSYFLEVTLRNILRRIYSPIVVVFIGAFIFLISHLIIGTNIRLLTDIGVANPDAFRFLLSTWITLLYSVKSYLFLYENDFYLKELFQENIKEINHIIIDLQGITKIRAYQAEGSFEAFHHGDLLILRLFSPFTLIVYTMLLGGLFLAVSKVVPLF